jgi:hypothetical protein
MKEPDGINEYLSIDVQYNIQEIAALLKSVESMSIPA